MVPHPEVATLVAHAGGWDEMLLVALPIAVVAALQVIGRRRTRPAEEVPRVRRRPPEANRRHDDGQWNTWGVTLDLLEVDAPAAPM